MNRETQLYSVLAIIFIVTLIIGWFKAFGLDDNDVRDLIHRGIEGECTPVPAVIKTDEDPYFKMLYICEDVVESILENEVYGDLI
tara:strand:- start:4289 stop:4543 length:255 start_codon:yes stop_codon:yes gene_type:complete